MFYLVLDNILCNNVEKLVIDGIDARASTCSACPSLMQGFVSNFDFLFTISCGGLTEMSRPACNGIIHGV